MSGQVRQPFPFAVDPGYGITPTGFARMRLPEIRQMIIDDLQARTGLTFETRPDSVTGQFIDTFAEREATIWELCEAVYFAMYPISSYGTNLDHAVSFAGVRRLFETKSRVFCVLYGVEGTFVIHDALIFHVPTRTNLILTEDVTITQTKAIDVTILVTGALSGVVYQVQIDNDVYTYPCTITDDDFSAAANLAAMMAATFDGVVSVDANQLRLTRFEFIPYNVILSATLSFIRIGSGGNFIAEEYGPTEIAVNTANQIGTTVTGWESVNNLVPGQTGRNDETDDELRRRYRTGVFRLGAATLEAIDANLRQNIQGMIALKCFENILDIVDVDGRDPHCIEVVIWGGDAQIIAYNIWLLKAAGITTFGDVVVPITDSNGYIHDIKFNRPFPVYIWVMCNVTTYTEEVFPTNGNQLVQDRIITTGNTFGIGVDVIIQRFHGPIFATIPGIQILDITIYGTTDPMYVPVAGDYVSVTIPINDRQLSRFDDFRTTVNIL